MSRREGLVYMAAGFLIAWTMRRAIPAVAFLIGIGVGVLAARLM